MKNKGSICKHKLCIGIVIFIVIIVLLTCDPVPIGHFRSKEGEKLYQQAYAEAMKLMPAPGKIIDINTNYGTVRVYKFLNTKSPERAPIVLLPGRASGVPMWASNLEGLAANRTVIALDALGDAGMSVQTRRIKNAADQAAWVEQVFDHLDLPRIHLVGHSFGGWLATNYAARYPERIVTLNLLEPVFVFQGIRLQIYLKTIPAAIPILPQAWRDKMLADIGGVSHIDLNDPIARLITYATKYYAVKLPVPVRITKDQLKCLTMPVYAALAEKSSIHNSAEAVNIAKANIRKIKVRSWTGATHSLPMEFPKQVDCELLEFMKEYEEGL